MHQVIVSSEMSFISGHFKVTVGERLTQRTCTQTNVSPFPLAKRNVKKPCVFPAIHSFQFHSNFILSYNTQMGFSLLKCDTKDNLSYEIKHSGWLNFV